MKKKTKTWLIVGAIALLVLGGGIGMFVGFGPSKTEKNTA